MLKLHSTRPPYIRSRVILALLPALAVLLAGCVQNLAPVQALITAGVGQASSPAVAVEADGTKHIVWSECVSTGATTKQCKIVYWRTRIGPALLQIDMVPPGSDERYDLPDIAVSADGQAYVVWRYHIGASGPYRFYYSMVRPNGGYDSPMLLEVEAGAEAPHVVARGNVVYAVYDTMPDNNNVWLRYQRLKPLDPAPGYLANTFNSIISAASMAIDSGGELHAAWKYAGPSGYQALFYGKPGLIRLIASDASPHLLYSAPAIAIDSADTVQIAFATYGAASDTLTRWARDSAGTETSFPVPLDSAQAPWRIHGGPHIAMELAVPIIAFSAENKATDNDEIWAYSPPSSGADSGPSRLTNNAWQDDEPQIVQLDSQHTSATLIAWRKYEMITLASPASTVRKCQGDIYQYDRPQARRVFVSPGNSCAYGGTLAGNGDWAAGVWIDSLSADSPRTVPWTTFNSYGAYLPLLDR